MSLDGQSLILARHGRTVWNRDGRYQGRSDPPLSPEGEVEAEVLARSFRGEAVSSIISSPLQRAATTARIVGEHLGLAPIKTDPRLAEIAFGAWEGLTQAEVKLRWPDQLRQWKQAPATMRFPGGETLGEARSRLLDFLRDATTFKPLAQPVRAAGAVLVVGHGGLIRLAVLEASGAPLADFRRVDIEPGSACRFVLETDGRTARLSRATLPERIEARHGPPNGIVRATFR